MEKMISDLWKEKIINFVLREEAGATILNDNAGLTICGITKKWHPDWAGFIAFDKEYFRQYDRYTPEWVRRFWLDNRNNFITRQLWALAYGFYNQLFEQSMTNIPEPIALQFFDTVVNAGKKQATILLQNAINYVVNANIEVDGHIGNETIGAVKTIEDYEKLRLYFLLERMFFNNKDSYRAGLNNRVEKGFDYENEQRFK